MARLSAADVASRGSNVGATAQTRLNRSFIRARREYKLRCANRHILGGRRVCTVSAVCATPQKPANEDITGSALSNVKQAPLDTEWQGDGDVGGSWDQACLWTEVSNPLADYESVDSTEIHTALLGSDHYRTLVPLMCWTHLLDKSEREVPLGIIIGHPHQHESEARAETLAAMEDSTAWHLPIMQVNASASIWRTLLQESESQSATTKAFIGTVLYGLGDVVAQVFQHGTVTNATELVSIMALGAVFEGVCNPWWNSEINRRIVETGTADAARVKSLRFFLNYIVWTPLCCEFYLVYEHLIKHPPDTSALLSSLPLLVDALLGVPEEGTIEIVEELEGFTDGLFDEIQVQGMYMMGANALKVWVPPPLRPLFTKLVEAGSWTVLE